MSYNLPGEMNPFEAPRSVIGEEARFRDFADDDAEMIRREHIGREANIKSLGHLSYLAAFLLGLLTIGASLMVAGVIPMPPGQAGLDPSLQRITFGFAAAFYLVFSTLNGAIGFGLTHLQAWARWTLLVFSILGLVATALYAVLLSVFVSPVAELVLFGLFGGINGLILWLLASTKAGVVFSREYKEIILKTPHVKLTTSLAVKIILVVFIAFVAIAFFRVLSR